MSPHDFEDGGHNIKCPPTNLRIEHTYINVMIIIIIMIMMMMMMMMIIIIIIIIINLMCKKMPFSYTNKKKNK